MRVAPTSPVPRRRLAPLAFVAQLVWAALAAPGASAQGQAQAPLERPVLVVVQSGISGDGGQGLRAQLAQQFQLDVISVRSARLSDTAHPAMLAIALDERGKLNATYWDGAGGFDQLSAPSPAQPDALDTAALTLACALVQRNIDALRAGLRKQPANQAAYGEDDFERAAFYAALMQRQRGGRLGIELRVEDF
jgi:hypothetical protein